MADITVTAANVLPGSDANVLTNYLAGETITAGMAVYLKSSDSRWWKAQCDSTAAEAGSAGLGIALMGSSAGQAVAVQISGSITIGATVVATTQYIVSATAGGICPIADIVSTNYLSLLGYGSTTAILIMNKNATGIVKA